MQSTHYFYRPALCVCVEFYNLIKHVLQAPDRFGSIYLHSSQTQNKSLVFSGPSCFRLKGVMQTALSCNFNNTLLTLCANARGVT